MTRHLMCEELKMDRIRTDRELHDTACYLSVCLAATECARLSAAETLRPQTDTIGADDFASVSLARASCASKVVGFADIGRQVV